MNLFTKQKDSDIKLWLGVWDQKIQTTTYKTDKQQGPTVSHRELYSIFCNKLKWKIT